MVGSSEVFVLIFGLYNFLTMFALQLKTILTVRHDIYKYFHAHLRPKTNVFKIREKIKLERKPKTRK